MWGVIPAAGLGTRIQPLAFSKELLPVGSRVERGVERPRAVSEYVIERMLRAGAEGLCIVISPGKADLVKYYGSDIDGVPVCYVVQPEPAGLCDAIFRAQPLVRGQARIFVALPDTIWFPEDGFRCLDPDTLSLLLFPSTHPERFDAVVRDADGHVREVQVKHAQPTSPWIWGAFSMPGAVFTHLHELWRRRSPRDEYFGTLVNEYIRGGGAVTSVPQGTSYYDVGTLEGYREAMAYLKSAHSAPGRSVPSAAASSSRTAGATSGLGRHR
jgi:dTDP-glucose pyrophosphorylase